MEFDVLQAANDRKKCRKRCRKRQQKKRQWKKAVVAMMMIVGLGTIQIMTFPAITLEAEAGTEVTSEGTFEATSEPSSEATSEPSSEATNEATSETTSDTSSETVSQSETDTALASEQTSETEQTSEAEQTSETEQTSEAEQTSETELSSESEQTSESEAATETESETTTESTEENQPMETEPSESSEEKTPQMLLQSTNAASALTYYCGFTEEHIHDSGQSCYYNFTYKCGQIAHTHFYLCETPPEYCNIEAHAHGEDCSAESGALICGKEEHLHMLACWINPESAGENTDAQGKYSGESQFHSNYFFRYQSGSHTVSSYETGVFLLIPDSEYTENWVPNTRQWSGSSNANYLVAYCSDDRTTSSKKGEYYGAYTLDTSRFSNEEQRRKVAAIIGHSYPFLTAEEMRAELAQAYEQGLLVDSAGNLVDVSDSTEADWIAAAQWAIWNTTTTYAPHAPEDIDIDDYGDDRPAAFPDEAERVCINPLSDPGYTDLTTARQKLDAIKNWLCSLQEPIALDIEHYEPELIENADGTRDLQVTVYLNREVVVGENTQFQLTAGSQTTTLETLPVGECSFSMLLKNVRDENLSGARVQLSVDGKHMQAYFFDSQNYQDMIGGNWEYYAKDLSFDVGSVKIDVSVHKSWQDGNPRQIGAVSVQLYANGKAYGDAVQLNDANGWTYVWEGLNKCDASGADIQYTVVEAPVEGYYVKLHVVEGGYDDTLTYTLWEAVDTFDGDGEYIILSNYGALTASYFKDRYYMNVSPVDVSVVEESQTASVWKASYDEAGSGYLLESKLYPGQYINGPADCINSNATPFHFADKKLYYVTLGGTNYYFRSFYSNGYQVYTNDATKAMSFQLYKLTTKTIPAKEVNFLVTNIPTKEAEYVLPNTGGTGTDRYTAGGLLLIMTAGYLLLVYRKKCRKEGLASS